MQPSPSSIPPSSAKWQNAKLGLIVALTALITSVAALVARKALETPPTPSAPRGIEKADPDKPPQREPAIAEIPADLKGSPADRFVRNQAERELAALQDQVSALRATQCELMRELRFARARLAQLEGGKRGVSARDAFMQRTTEWALCPPVKGDAQRQALGSLNDAADGALGRK
jgi:hypothetical protein